MLGFDLILYHNNIFYCKMQACSHCKNVPKLILPEVFFRICAETIVGAKTKPHREDCIEMLQFWSKGGYFIVRNHIFPITPGTLLIVNAMETHYSNPSNVDTYNRSKIILSFKRFRQICELCDFNALYEELYLHDGALRFLSHSRYSGILIHRYNSSWIYPSMHPPLA